MKFVAKNDILKAKPETSLLRTGTGQSGPKFYPALEANKNQGETNAYRLFSRAPVVTRSHCCMRLMRSNRSISRAETPQA